MLKKVLTFLIFGSLLTPFTVLGKDAFRFVHMQTVYADVSGKKISRPEGVACNGETVVVADTANGRLLKYSWVKDALVGGDEISLSQIIFPIRVQISRKGDILVLDGKSGNLLRLDLSGKFIEKVEIKGLPGGLSPIIRSFALDREDGIYLLDVFDGRVIVLNSTGEYQKDIPFPQSEGFFSDLAVGPLGTIYLLDSVKANVYTAQANALEFQKLASDLREYVSFPANITVDEHGALFLVDRNGGGVVQLGPDGSYLGRQLVLGWKDGLVYYPEQMCILEADESKIFIADRGNSRVQVFKLVY